MKTNKRTLIGIFAAIAMLTIILDGKTAISSAVDAINLCFQSVIPTLLPFFFLSGLLNSYLFGRKIRTLKWLESFCKIPTGSVSIFLIGLVSGYPVGAQLVFQSYKSGGLDEISAKRMLCFCSNAGPAFIFGILAPLFSNARISWALWLIHIISAIFASRFLPAIKKSKCIISDTYTITMSQSLQNALRTAATVCGWVLMFRVLIGFLQRWFLWLFPIEIRILLCGILELTNGCTMLSMISQESLRFILASVLLSAGGLCVIMQTGSVSQSLGFGLYFPGKLVQTIASFLLSVYFQPILFDKNDMINIHPIIISTLITVLVIGYVLTSKKVVDFMKRLLYNSGRNADSKGESVCYFAKE